MTVFPQRLVDGYRAFLSERLPHEQTRFRELADRGQSPEIMVIGCCDSRVSPEVIFDARPGELFVVRNVANQVPPYAPDGAYHGVSAALEFAVAALKVKHIVVLGHARCGGVRAFAEDAEPLSPGDFIGNWMELMAPALAKRRSARRTAAGGLAGAARAGLGRQQPRQSDDLSAPRQTGRARRHRPARRLFRRRHRRSVGARSGDRRVRARRRRRARARVRDAAVLAAAGPVSRPS